jgi:hypothetical protein
LVLYFTGVRNKSQRSVDTYMRSHASLDTNRRGKSFALARNRTNHV